jgi:DNA gyrase subunit A
MIITRNGITIRMEVEGIREAGQSSQGLKLINLAAGDTIGSIERIAKMGDAEEAVSAPVSLTPTTNGR